MIYELRTYTCYPGTVPTVLDMWEKQGKAMLDPYFKMVGQWTSETGTANQIVTLWAFDDMNHRQEMREKLMKHPGFLEYLTACRKYYVTQTSQFLSATALSPIK
ncbi:NIPSNAP family protein [Fulvivirgaceae bacterium BMA12]|uniref:NIPSNAP family protein n=1 Tax=Agaribacillus aureus TaxID=3051825 RepID=A0ABT8KZK5_9BACT|nr:NIPSNAP family protein [Fulvivirgaceae bacterium BMA12]